MPAERQAAERAAYEDAQTGIGDSVRLYLQEIGDTDLLTMQEEVWLAKRMERGKLAEERLQLGSLLRPTSVRARGDKLDGDARAPI